jgi:hypothetical protein
VAVADEFGGGVRSVTAVEQPAEVLHGGAQRGKLTRAKELFVPGSRPAMGLVSRHDFMMTQRAEEIIPFAPEKGGV